jgi:glutaredoxin
LLQIVVFSQTFCEYSKSAKEILERAALPFTAVEIDRQSGATGAPAGTATGMPASRASPFTAVPEGISSNDIKEALKEMTGAGTTPRIFLDGKYWADSAALRKMEDEGKLAGMLKGAGFQGGEASRDVAGTGMKTETVGAVPGVLGGTGQQKQERQQQGGQQQQQSQAAAGGRGGR